MQPPWIAIRFFPPAFRSTCPSPSNPPGLFRLSRNSLPSTELLGRFVVFAVRLSVTCRPALQGLDGDHEDDSGRQKGNKYPQRKAEEHQNCQRGQAEGQCADFEDSSHVHLSAFL